MSRRESSNPSPTYLPVARMTRSSREWMRACQPWLPLLLLAEPGPQGNQVSHLVRESSLETVQMVIAFGQHEG